MQDSTDQAQRHARLLAKQKSWWNPVLCRQKGYEEVLWRTQDNMVPRARSGTTPLLSADGTSLLTDKEAILKRWAEQFDGVLNQPSSINDEAINRLPQVECNPLLDELPTVSETVKAIKLLSSGKAPGSDAIPTEIYKAGGPPVAEKLAELFHIMWRKKPSLKNWRMQQLSTYSKGKGILKSMTIIEASLYCQLLGRSLLGSYWIDWMNILNSQGFYQKASVDSGKTEEQ